MTKREQFGQDLLDQIEPLLQDIEDYETIDDGISIVRELAEQLRDEIHQFRDS